MANSTKPSEGTPPSYCTDLLGTTAQIKDGKPYFCLVRHSCQLIGRIALDSYERYKSKRRV